MTLQSAIGLICILSFLFDGVGISSSNATRIYWLPTYFISVVYTIIPLFHNYSFYNILSLSFISLSFISSIISCSKSFDIEQVHIPPDEFICGITSYLTFSYLNTPIINLATKKKILQVEDVPFLCDKNCCELIWINFKYFLKNTKDVNLFSSLFSLIKWDWMEHGFFQLCASVSSFIAPLALERLLSYVSPNDAQMNHLAPLFEMNIIIAVSLLFLGPFLNALSAGQNYARGRYIATVLS